LDDVELAEEGLLPSTESSSSKFLSVSVEGFGKILQRQQIKSLRERAPHRKAGQPHTGCSYHINCTFFKHKPVLMEAFSQIISVLPKPG